jgi:predicted nucleic acid-binding protein
MLESVAVLTRLPAGLAVQAEDAVRTLRDHFPGPVLTVDDRAFDDLLDVVVGTRLRGGQVYDALIGQTAKAAGARLLTRDRRALPTYRAFEVDFELLD